MCRSESRLERKRRRSTSADEHLNILCEDSVSSGELEAAQQIGTASWAAGVFQGSTTMIGSHDKNVSWSCGGLPVRWTQVGWQPMLFHCP